MYKGNLLMATSGSAGYDITSLINVDILPQTRVLIPTGVYVNLKKGTFGLLKSRSGLACKGIDVKAGVIDSDYSDEIKVLLSNESDVIFSVKQGMRIAQLIVVVHDIIHQTDEIKEHGHKGFGSTGF